jgi:hypothetical protein
MRRAGLLVLVTLLTGCGAVQKEQASTCGDHLKVVDSSFRDLPKGLEYAPMPDEQMKAIRESAGDAFIANEAKLITADSVPQGVVLVLVMEKPLAGQKDEDDFMRGFGSTFGEGGTPEPVDLPGGPATRIDGGTQTAFVRVYDRCRVVTVGAADGRLARRAAVAVVR